jgi:phosphatidylserine/phosphatidylglycerophosphate/cardiolipin synthase-like enzyme
MNLWKLFPLTFLLSCQAISTPPGDAGSEAAILKAAPAPTPEAIPAPPPAVTIDASGAWSLHFSPNGGCEDAVSAFIGTATDHVYLMAYGFTSLKVANALIAKKASGHGIDVEVVLDRSDKTAKNSMAGVVRNGNVPVYIDAKHPIMHDKLIMVDGKSFETGSFNYTASAEHGNAENCLIEQDSTKTKLYEANFDLHKAHSEPLPFPN